MPDEKPKSKETGYYEKLSEEIPEKYHTKIFRKNFDGSTTKLTGFPAQIVIDRLNDIFGPSNWVTNEEILKQEIVGRCWVVVMRVSLRITANPNPTNDRQIKPEELQKTGYGACYAKRVEDAYGAAFTSGLKRAGRQLGIGKELYLGASNEDVEESEEELEPEKKKEEPIPMTDDITNMLKLVADAKNSTILDALETKIDEADFGPKVLKIVIKAFNEKKKEFGNKGKKKVKEKESKNGVYPA